MTRATRFAVLSVVLLLSLPAATGSVVAAGGDAGAAAGVDGDGPVVVIDDRTDRVRVLDGDGDVLAAGDIDETAAVLRESGQFTDAEVERLAALVEARDATASDPLPFDYDVSCSGLGCDYYVIGGTAVGGGNSAGSVSAGSASAATSTTLFTVAGIGLVAADASGSDARTDVTVLYIGPFGTQDVVALFLTADGDDVFVDGSGGACVRGECVGVGR